MHQPSRKDQRRLTLVRECAAYCQAIASNTLGFLILTLGHAPFNLAHASCIFLELRLGVVVGLDNRLGSFLEIVELAQLVRNTRQDLLHGQADRALGVRNNTFDWHRHSLLDLAQQLGQVLGSSTVERAGKQDLARESVAQHPEDILGLEGLEAVQSQDDVALLLEELLEASLVGEAQSEQFFVAFEQVGDSALGDSNVALLERAMDFGDGAMLAVAQHTDESDDVKAELAVGECPGAFLLRTNGLAVTRAGWIVAAADAEGQAGDMLKSGDGARGVVASPEGATTA
jgi:hypothetical protein